MAAVIQRDLDTAVKTFYLTLDKWIDTRSGGLESLAEDAQEHWPQGREFNKKKYSPQSHFHDIYTRSEKFIRVGEDLSGYNEQLHTYIDLVVQGATVYRDDVETLNAALEDIHPDLSSGLSPDDFIYEEDAKAMEAEENEVTEDAPAALTTTYASDVDEPVQVTTHTVDPEPPDDLLPPEKEFMDAMLETYRKRRDHAFIFWDFYKNQ